MKLLAMPCRATQDGWVIAESSDKCGPLEEGTANTPVYFPVYLSKLGLEKEEELEIIFPTIAGL